MDPYIKIINNTEEFLRIEGAWKELEKKSGHNYLTLSFDWMKAFWLSFHDVNNDIFGHNKELCIALVYDSSQLTAIAPLLMVERYKQILGFKKKVRYIEFIGQQWACTFADIICLKNDPNIILKFIIESLLRNFRFDVIKLSYVPDMAFVFKDYEEYMHKFTICSSIKLSGEYSKIVKAHYSKNLRNNIKKYKNKISRSFNEVKCEILEDPESIRKIFEDIKSVSSTKIYSNKHNNYDNVYKEQFLKRLISDNEKAYCITYLENDRRVAYNVGFKYNGAVYAFDGSYDRTFANEMNISYGSLVIDKTVEYFSEKFNELYLGVGYDQYKFYFTKEFQYLNTFLYPGNTHFSGAIHKYLKSKHSKEEEILKGSLKDIINR